MTLVDTNSVRNAHALPLPADVAAANRGAAEAYAQMMEGADIGGEANVALLRNLVQALMRDARDPPKKVQGVGQDFLDGRSWVYSCAVRRGLNGSKKVSGWKGEGDGVEKTEQ